MQNIEVKTKEENESGWVFDVSVDGASYEVEVGMKDYERLTDKKIAPEELVKKSFEFLLEREPKEAILKSFNITEISKYFPEYESKIK